MNHDLSRPIPIEQLSARVQALEIAWASTIALADADLPEFANSVIDMIDGQRRAADETHPQLSFALQDLMAMVRSVLD